MFRPTKYKSPAYVLCKHVWNRNQEATPGHAWQRLNHSMHSAVVLAITSGMRFMKCDFKKLMDDFRGAYWFGCEHERFYSAAVDVRNISACQAYEEWAGRKPFILEGERMFVGRQFIWDGHRVTCTSITPDHFIAVEPRGATEDHVWVDKVERFTRYDRTPKRRFKITRPMLKALKSTSRAAKCSQKQTEQVAA